MVEKAVFNQVSIDNLFKSYIPLNLDYILG